MFPADRNAIIPNLQQHTFFVNAVNFRKAYTKSKIGLHTQMARGEAQLHLLPLCLRNTRSANKVFCYSKATFLHQNSRTKEEQTEVKILFHRRLLRIY